MRTLTGSILVVLGVLMLLGGAAGPAFLFVLIGVIVLVTGRGESPKEVPTASSQPVKRSHGVPVPGKALQVASVSDLAALRVAVGDLAARLDQLEVAGEPAKARRRFQRLESEVRHVLQRVGRLDGQPPSVQGELDLSALEPDAETDPDAVDALARLLDRS